MTSSGQPGQRSTATRPVAGALLVAGALAVTGCEAGSDVRPVPTAPAGQELQAVRLSDRASSKQALRLRLVVELAQVADAATREAERERVLAELRSFGAVPQDRLEAGRSAILVEAPAAAIDRIRALPGVRSVGVVRDAERWPGLPDR